MRRELSGYLLAAAVSAAARRGRALTTGGAVGATLVGGALFSHTPPATSVALLGFFIPSSLLTRLPGAITTQDAGGRTLAQVLANGGAAAAGAVVYGRGRSPRALVFIGGSLSAATADTWATELGTRYGGTARLVTTLRPVPPGADGGVTPVGLVATVVSACALSVLYSLMITGADRRKLALSCALGGIGGSLIDSLLGATLERRPGGGVRFLNNDAVNALNTLAGGALASLLLRTDYGDVRMRVAAR